MSYYNQIAGKRLGRIEALSDGVFAIAMTILVFDLKDPLEAAAQSDTQLFTALLGLAPKFLSYLLSFMMLGIFWTGQSTQFHYIEKYDRNLSWITLFFLLFISLLPFSTGVLSNHITNRTAVGLYWLNILAPGILLYLHWWYAAKHDCLSLPKAERAAVDKAIKSRVVTAQSLYAFGALLCWVSTYLSIGFIILVQLNYAFAPFGSKPKK